MEVYTINGIEVEYDTFDLDNMDKFDEYERAVKEAAEKTKNSKSGEEMKNIHEYVDCVLDFFDAVLGANMTEKIFGEKRNLRDISKAYILFHNAVSEKMEGELSSTNAVTQPKMNREQRRAAARDR